MRTTTARSTSPRGSLSLHKLFDQHAALESMRTRMTIKSRLSSIDLPNIVSSRHLIRLVNHFNKRSRSHRALCTAGIESHSHAAGSKQTYNSGLREVLFAQQ
jgi:hypothetical protein